MVRVIGISGISGAGTSTITKALGKALNATALFWDDFDDISQSPDDYVEWFHKSGDYGDWHYPALENTLKELKEGRTLNHPATREKLVSTPLVIFDASLGRQHSATARFVDFFIHLDTNMDVALARRLIRDYGDNHKASISDVLDELQWYLSDGRPLFDARKIKASADFVVNGDNSVEKILAVIMLELKRLFFLK